MAIGNLVSVSWGYRTARGPQSSRMADLWIAGFEHRRSGGVSTLRIYVEGGWELLRRSRQRTQVVHTGSDSYLQVLVRIMARAGLRLTSAGVSSRATSVTPKFTVHPQTSGFEALRQALARLGDRVRMSPLAGCAVFEPLASDASAYTFGTSHPLRAVRLRAEPAAVSEAQAFGAGAFGEAIDFAAGGAGIGTRELVRDITSTTGGAAAATAVAHLRQRALDAHAGSIVVPPHCGAELLDVIDFSDASISASAVKRRIAGIEWRYDRHRAVYEQRITLGAV